MHYLDPSRFTIFSFGGLDLLIGFRGGVYMLTPEMLSFLEGRQVASKNVAEIEEELRYIVRREGEADDIPYMPARTLRALCLNVTMQCNLRCSYCFVGTDLTSDSLHMSEKTGKKAIDLLFANSAPDSLLQVDFFGGEPLLNFDLVKSLISYAKDSATSSGRKIKFTLTTNAILLDREIAEYLNREDVSLILSLDGNRETNDKNRKSISGSSMWERIVDNIKWVIKSRDGKEYYVRGTFTPYTLNLTETCDFFADNGITKFSLEAAKGKRGYPWSVTERELQTIKDEYEKLALKIREYRATGIPVDFFHFNVYLDTPLCAPRRLSGCGAAVEYISVDPSGNIYPCHQLHSEEFSMGSVWDKNASYDVMRKKFERSTVRSKKGCGECWARFYCSGGCHASSWNTNNDIDTPDLLDCELQRHRIKCAVWLEASGKIHEINNKK